MNMTKVDTHDRIVYSKIRDWIMEGTVLPGEWLREQDLVDQIGVSRTPIREALGRLATEGLIEIRPRRGAVVRKLSSSEYIEIYKMREVLETLACKWVSESFETVPIDKLADILGDLEIAENNLDIQRRLVLVREFFFTIFEATSKPHLIRVLSNLWDLSHHYRRFFSGISATVPMRMEYYSKMCEACKEKDGDQLVSALQGLYSFVERTLIPILGE